MGKDMTEDKIRVVLLTGAGASKPLGLPVMTDFVDPQFWRQGDTWTQMAGYLSDKWAHANSGTHDFEYIYTLSHLLSEVTIDKPLAFLHPAARPQNLFFKREGNIQIEGIVFLKEIDNIL